MNNLLILTINNLEKEYGGTKAVRGVSFQVRSGEIIGLLGPNGAGKTTIISMILGVLKPSAGTIEILGKNPQNEKEVMGAVNFTTVSALVPGNMTVWENLYIFGLLYEVNNLPVVITELLKEFSLEKFKDTRTGLLSSGEQTRVELAKATINAPRLLLLDEPTSSLDPSTAHLIRDKIKKLAKTNNTAIVWTSHNMHEIEAVCDRVLFLSRGKILLEGDPKELPKKYNKTDLEDLFIAIAREPLILGFE